MKPIVLLGLVASFLQASEAPKGALELHLTTSFGGPVSPGQVTIRTLDGSSVVARIPSEKLGPQNLPYGSYEITFESPGWQTKRRTVKIDQERVFVTLAIEPDPLIPMPTKGYVSLSVRVQPPRSCSVDGLISAKLVG